MEHHLFQIYTNVESLDSVETTSENEDSPKQSENEDSPKQSENEDSPKQSENEDSPKQSENEDSPKQSENEDSPKQLETENKLLAAKLARKIGKRNSLLDEFRDILIEKINNNFDIMERIVENTNEEIESLNTNTTGTNNEEHNESSQETHENKLEHKSKRTEIDIKTAEEKPYVTPISSEMTETRCKQVENVSEDNFDLPTLKEIPLSEISLIPEVYIKPGVTDINKKLITQLEANDSFICFQKLMRKNRKKVKKFSKTRSKQEISNSVPKISSTFSHETITSNQSCRTPKRGQKRITKPSEVAVSNASISKKSISRNYFSKSLATMKTDGESFKLKRVFMKSDLRTKYSDSLWFSDRYVMKKSLVDKTETSPREKVKRKKITKKSSQKHVENKRPKSHQNKKVTINNSSATLLNFKRTRSLNKCTIGIYELFIQYTRKLVKQIHCPIQLKYFQ
ncbi:hypothetical protein JTB14_032015 [Gonioctena quinquepunctata]|nr:hypothetical protein JTB14_032015 [Gonioctena quinquepunctata]